MAKQKRWGEQELEFLRANYPVKGKVWCAEQLDRTEAMIRTKAAALGLKQDRAGEFFADWQNRARLAKIGKKRPEHAEAMRELALAGKLFSEITPERRAVLSERMKAHIKKNGHPRGALGMRHTEECKAAMSEKSIERWKQLTEEQVSAQVMKMMKTKEAKGNLINQRPQATWKAGWREIGGVNKYYRSRWEANYARYLEALKQAGEIQNWEHEPETFWFEAIKRGTRSYLPDFRVTHNDGSTDYHEVKGWMDDRSKTKIKRMAKYHPTVKLVIIDAKAYRAMAREFAGKIFGWEE